jgi:hypothetical protein
MTPGVICALSGRHSKGWFDNYGSSAFSGMRPGFGGGVGGGGGGGGPPPPPPHTPTKPGLFPVRNGRAIITNTKNSKPLELQGLFKKRLFVPPNECA